MKKEARQKREKEEELKYEQELKEAEKEEESVKAYQKWEDEVERRKNREKRRLKKTQPISPYPFRPSSNTVPFGR